MPFEPCLIPQQPLWEVFHLSTRWGPADWAEVRRRAPVRARAGPAPAWQFRRRRLMPLPDPLDGEGPGVPLARALRVRRSARALAGGPLAWEEISVLLWAAAGQIPSDGVEGHPRRTAPSAGACYPIETFFWLPTPPDGASVGPYHFQPHPHGVRELFPETAVPLRTLLAACPYPALVEAAGLLVVLAAVFERITAPYGGRGYRFLLLEAGHMAQNVYLAAAALGLGVVAIGGWDDAVLDGALGLDGRQAAAVYAVAVGHADLSCRDGGPPGG